MITNLTMKPAVSFQGTIKNELREEDMKQLIKMGEFDALKKCQPFLDKFKNETAPNDTLTISLNTDKLIFKYNGEKTLDPSPSYYQVDYSPYHGTIVPSSVSRLVDKIINAPTKKEIAKKIREKAVDKATRISTLAQELKSIFS